MNFLDATDYRVRSAAAAMLEERITPTRQDIIRDALKARLAAESTAAVRSRLVEILRDLKRR